MDGERFLGQIPDDKDDGERDRKEHRRDDIGDMKHDMKHVGDHRAEDSDHHDGQPVDPGDVATHDKLQDQRGGEADAAEKHRDDGINRAHQII